MNSDSGSAKKLQLKMPEYHQSSINMFLKCPRQYMYRYLMNIIIPPKSALTLGVAFDAGVTANLSQKIATKTDLAISDVLDAYSSNFEKRAPETDWSGDDPGQQKDLGVKMLKAFHEKASPNIKPVTVQEGFRVETDAGYALAGTLDCTDENGFIRDTKTSKAEYPADAVSTEIQPAVYDFAYQAKNGKKPAGFIYDVATKHKEPRVQEVKGQVSQTQTEQLFEAVKLMHGSVQRGEFQYAAPGSWWCSKDWCGYWALCKGKK